MKFLLPLLLAAATTTVCSAQQTIVEIASSTDAVSTLVAAIAQADLVAVLSDTNTNLTVFAPTNDAFAAVEGVSKFLEDPWKAHLRGILNYHVLEGRITSDMLVDGMEAPTVEGSNVVITLDPVRVNGVDVLNADIDASNGVIHLVDQVLIPPFLTTDIVEVLSSLGPFSILVELVVAAGLVDTLKLEGPYTVFAPNDDAVRLK